VHVAHTRGIASPTIRRELRRRSAIEPVIGHLKADGLLERNHLKGAAGDLVNALLCAIGHNLRLLLAWFRKLLWLLRHLVLTALRSCPPRAA
jgi:IS5 family transposase